MNAKCLANTLNQGLAESLGNDYPLRRLARVFSYVAVGAYAAALVLIAVESAIIEF